MAPTKYMVQPYLFTRNLSMNFKIRIFLGGSQIFTFFCVFSCDKLTEQQKELLEWNDESVKSYSLHVNKAICLLSPHSFGDTFERWLQFLQVSKIKNN